jgi:signal transduction histidine kinase
MQEQIFDRFRQAEESMTRNFGGNGLGLAISKALVEMMNGKIWLRSEEGKGTQFFFSLPYEKSI